MNHTHSIPVTDTTHQHAVHTHVGTTEQSSNADAVDKQAGDVGTAGEQLVSDPVLNTATLQAIADGKPTFIGMDLASEPDRTAYFAPKGSEANPLTEADAAADLAGEPRPASVVITPTVGRKVWFFPNGCQFHSTPKCIDEDSPMDADVVYVWGDRMVNLTVKDHIGQVHAFTSVPFMQPGDGVPIAGNAYAMWMPYQVGQAKAAAAA